MILLSEEAFAIIVLYPQQLWDSYTYKIYGYKSVC